VIGPDENAFVTAMVTFGLGYASAVRQDHALFVDAFRELQGPLRDLFRE
jgi:hypothetical protein